MNFLDAFFSLFKKKPTPKGIDYVPGIYPGVLLDTRSEEEKASDISFGEIVSKADPVIWREKPESEWRSFGGQDQNGQSSCVANAGRKVGSILFKINHNLDVDFSSLDIYRRRYNYPEAGMVAYDLWNVMKKGMTLNSLVPSDRKSEAVANALEVAAYARTVGDVFKINGGGINLPTSDIEAVASVIQRTGKGVVLFYYFTNAEWSSDAPSIKTPGLALGGSGALHHAVAAVDFTLINGVKHLVIEDSALFGRLDRRVISQSFHAYRNFYAGYPMNFVFDPVKTEKIVHRFVRDIPFGENSDEVVVLQKCLQSEGFFPLNIEATGFYGSVTADAVLGFQKKYAVASPGALDRLAGKNVGEATRGALNKIFA